MRLDSVTPKWISQIQYASEDAIARQADAIRKSQRALFRAIKLMRDSRKEAAQLVSKKLGWTPGGRARRPQDLGSAAAASTGASTWRRWP